MNDLLGYFDILGFRSFCVNNAAETAAKKVLDTIESLDTVIPAILNRTRREPIPSAVLPDLRWLIFSDTVFVSLSFERSRTPEDRISRAFLFLVACSALQRSMFEVGLPLRGVIHTGHFVATQRCFAGSAIIDAYELAQQLELSACVLTAEASQFYSEMIPAEHKLAPFVRGFLIDYDVPVKAHSVRRLKTLNWFLMRWLASHPEIGDIHRFVSERFSSHKKTVRGEALAKADNTVQLIRFWNHVVPGVVA